MAKLPLLRHRLDATFALRESGPVRADQFVAAVRALAAGLPERRHAINLCGDRLRFTLGFAAALLRGQTSLMPPNQAPDFIERLEQAYPDSYRLTDDLLERAAGASGFAGGETPAIDADDVAAVLFTSGSTGEPQPHPKSWSALVDSARGELERFAAITPPGMALLATVPAQHMYGLESTVMMCLQGGLAMHCGRPLFPADVCAQLEALPRPRALVTTPVHLRALLQGMNRVPCADFILCATAPLAPQLAAQAEARFGAVLHEVYGCTEAGQVATRRTVMTPEWALYRDFRLRQDEKGTWLRGPHVPGELLLADVIELRPDERFILHGRTGDLVNIAGKRTSLAALNYHLNSIPGVRDGVFVVPAEGEGAVIRLAAFVVAPERSEDEIIQALKQRIDPAFLPRRVRFVAALPRNDVGKLPQAALSGLGDPLARQGRLA